VHRLMHTSVEKHALRITISCGTLTTFTNGITSGAAAAKLHYNR
jgi:hypothetical protein